MLIVPVSAKPAQTFNSVLGGQNCKINLYQKSTGLFADLYVNGNPLVTGLICRDRVRWVRHEYLGFIGDLALCDTQGVADPDYTGLGARFVLIYLEAGDL